MMLAFLSVAYESKENLTNCEALKIVSGMKLSHRICYSNMMHLLQQHDASAAAKKENTPKAIRLSCSSNPDIKKDPKCKSQEREK